MMTPFQQMLSLRELLTHTRDDIKYFDKHAQKTPYNKGQRYAAWCVVNEFKRVVPLIIRESRINLAKIDEAQNIIHFLREKSEFYRHKSITTTNTAKESEFNGIITYLNNVISCVEYILSIDGEYIE